MTATRRVRPVEPGGPLRPGPGALLAAFGGCAVRTAILLARRRLRLPRGRIGLRLAFGDGTTSRVYRETVNLESTPADPSLLVVAFQLRGIGRSRLLHALFRAESLLNTPLFAGFPGFSSKLWLTDLDTGVYHGVYRWDGVDAAVSYATTLSALLRLVSRPGTVRFHAEAGVTPEGVLADPSRLASAEGSWWGFRVSES